MSIKSALLLSLAAVSLAACAGPRVAPNTDRTTYLSEMYQYGAGGRQLKLQVLGNPFADSPKSALEALVENSSDSAGLLQPPTHPRLQPDDSAKPNYRLMVQFDRQGGNTPQGLCDGQGSDKASPGPGDITVVMAFCVSGKAFSGATGWIDATSLQDPGIPELIRRMELELFHPDDSIQGDSNPS